GDILNSSKTIALLSLLSVLRVPFHFSRLTFYVFGPHPLCFTLHAWYHSHLCTLIQPDLRILDLAQQVKPIQRFTQQGSTLFEVRLSRLGLLAKSAEPFHKRGKLFAKDLLHIFLHEA